VIAAFSAAVAGWVSEAPFDDKGYTTHHWFWPERAELIYGGLAFLIVAAGLWKYGLPQAKKAMAARTDRIQKQLDDAAADLAAAEAEATNIRAAKGDIAAERARILADADVQAAGVLEDGRARLAQEMVDLEAKSMADIGAAGARVGDELRSEIARLSSAAIDHVVTGTLDEQTHQQLIEDFISRVGAGR
jgi:F-type H+-transporting ATPase subunit b